MNFDEYQAMARSTAIYPEQGNNFIYPTLGLVGEAGEVAEKVKKVIRDNCGILTAEKKAEIINEISDVMWYVANLCEELGTTMENVAKLNIKKLTDRKNRNALRGSGDSR